MNKLGKLPYRHDPRTLHLSDYLDLKALPPVPATFNHGSKITSWPMFANDRLGDCTCAGVGHALETWSSDNTIELTITDDEVITFYEYFGYNPDDPNTDQGAVELDVLRKWSRTGFAIGTTLHKAATYLLVNPKEIAPQQAAIYLFGGLYSGVQLPVAAQQMGQHWSVPSDLNDPNSQPGSWGGHAVWAIGYDANGITVVSWGQLITVDWGFVATYFDEQWAILDPQDFFTHWESPQGFNWQQLLADLAIIKQ